MLANPCTGARWRDSPLGIHRGSGPGHKSQLGARWHLGQRGCSRPGRPSLLERAFDPRKAFKKGTGVRGGTAPRQPLPGTREAWPRRVGWLSHLSVAQASPADASEAPLRAPPEAAGEALTSRPPDRRPTAETWESGESRFARWSRRGAWTSPMSSGPGRGRRSRRQRPREWRTPEAPAPGCRPTIGAVRRGWRFGPSGLPFTGSREHNRKHRGSRQDCPNA